MKRKSRNLLITVPKFKPVLLAIFLVGGILVGSMLLRGSFASTGANATTLNIAQNAVSQKTTCSSIVRYLGFSSSLCTNRIWCAAFVSWVYEKAGFNFVHTTTATVVRSQFKASSRATWHDRTSNAPNPVPGGVVLMCRALDCSGPGHHVAIIAGFANSGRDLLIIGSSGTTYPSRSTIYHYRDGGCWSSSCYGGYRVVGWGELNVDTTDISAVSPSCSRTKADVDFTSATTKTALAGSTLNYTIRIKNMDSTDCGISRFKLESADTSTLYTKLSDSSVLIKVGQNYYATVGVTAKAQAGAGSYPFVIKVSNADLSGSTTQVTGYFKIPDVIAPNVKIDYPDSQAKDSISKPIKISASATDNVGVSYIELLIDGVKIDSDNASSTWTNWNPKSYSPGQHTLTARAKDASGNQGSVSITITVKP